MDNANLREMILEEHSRAQKQKIVGWINNDPERIALLFAIFFHDEHIVAQRAAWVVSELAASGPQLLRDYVPQLVRYLGDTQQHNAVRRNILKALQYMELPEITHAALLNTCFQYVADPKEYAAVRAFSLTILARMSRCYPDIKQELLLILEDMLLLEHKPSFRSRAKAVLRELKKKEK